MSRDVQTGFNYVCYDALGLGTKYRMIYTTEWKMFGLCTSQQDVDGTWMVRKSVLIESEPDNSEWNKCKIASINQDVSHSETERRKQQFGAKNVHYSSFSLLIILCHVDFPGICLERSISTSKKREVNRIVTSRVMKQNPGKETKEGRKGRNK
jgi:hypothetical protein